MYVDGEPAGTMRLRWFHSFCKFERCVVLRRYRGLGIHHEIQRLVQGFAGARDTPGSICICRSATWPMMETEGFRRVDDRVFNFSDHEYSRSIAISMPVEGAVKLDVLPMVINRPEDRWMRGHPREVGGARRLQSARTRTPNDVPIERSNMSPIVQSIGGEAVTTKLAMKMEDSLQAFAVRAACFIGELDVRTPRNSTATISAPPTSSPVSATSRWRAPRALVPVLRHARAAGRHPALPRARHRPAPDRTLPRAGREPRLQHALRPGPADRREVLGKAGWRRLLAEEASTGAKRIVAMVRTVDPSKPLPAAEAPE